jgi:hypothetical protein
MVSCAAIFTTAPALSALAAEARAFSGDLEVLIEDSPDLAQSRTLYFLKSEGQRYRLDFPKAPPQHLRTGMRVSFAGTLSGESIAVGSNDPVVWLLPEAQVTGSRAAITLRVAFQDAPVSCASGNVANIMWDGTFSMDSLYQDTSFGAVAFPRDTDNDGQADIFDVTIPSNIDDPCDPDAWALEADDEATASGIDLSLYQHRVYVLPVSSCSWAGRANVGCGTFCRVWVDTCALPDVYAHELGHNLSMRHASTDDDNDDAIDNNYGDISDFMGYGGYGWRQINGPHMLEMGWLPAGQVVDADHQGTQTYVLSPLETDPASALYPQLVRVARSTQGDDIFLSYRRREGHDAGLRTEYVDKTSIHSHDGAGTATLFLKALADGEQFDDPSTGLSVVQLSHDNVSVTLQVTLPVVGCAADTDGDGVCDADDACPGGDDTLDGDSDGVPDSCDVCPADPDNDMDGDGVCGDLDCDSGNPGASAPPSSISDVISDSIANGHRYSWTDQASITESVTVYDVYSGSLSDVRTLGGDFSQGACHLENTTTPSFDHQGPAPSPGDTLYFLIRAQNECPSGTSSFGSAERDGSIAGSGVGCQ